MSFTACAEGDTLFKAVWLTVNNPRSSGKERMSGIIPRRLILSCSSSTQMPLKVAVLRLLLLKKVPRAREVIALIKLAAGALCVSGSALSFSKHFLWHAHTHTHTPRTG